MREVIMSLIRKVIVPKYGKVNYSVVGTNHFPRSMYNHGYGYIVTYTDIPKKKQDSIAKETRMLLDMLGLKKTLYMTEKDIIEVWGIEEQYENIR